MIWSRGERWLLSICGGALVVCVSAMLSLSLLGIVLRWFELSLPWIDPVVRHLVFLVVFLGGVMATGRGKHISIDLCGRYLAARGRWRMGHQLQALISLVAGLSLVWLAWSGWQLVQVEWQYGRPRFLGIHSAVLLAIIPGGSSLVAGGFLLRFLGQISHLSRPSPEGDGAHGSS